MLPSHSSVWRKRFEDQYDLPLGHDSTEIKIEYQTRAIVLAEKVSFKNGEQEEQELWLEVIKTLIVESYHPATSDPPLHSKNLDRIQEVLCISDFLHRPVSGYGQRLQHRPSDSFCAVQLVRTSCGSGLLNMQVHGRADSFNHLVPVLDISLPRPFKDASMLSERL